MFNLLSAVVKLGDLSIAIIDIVAFVFLFIAIITGISKGFARQLLSLLGLIAAIAVAILLCGTVSKFITEKMPGLYASVESFVAKTMKLNTSAAQTEAALREALSNSAVPAFLHEALIKSVVESGFEVAILAKVTGWALNVISFLFLFIVSRIIFAILKKIIFKFVELPFIRTVDKLLGLIFSLIKCILLITIILLVLSIFMGTKLNDLLIPNGNPSLINKLLEAVMNLPFMTKLLGGIIA